MASPERHKHYEQIGLYAELEKECGTKTTEQIHAYLIDAKNKIESIDRVNIIRRLMKDHRILSRFGMRSGHVDAQSGVLEIIHPFAPRQLNVNHRREFLCHIILIQETCMPALWIGIYLTSP